MPYLRHHHHHQQQAGLAPGRVRAGDGMGVASSNAGARNVAVKFVVDKGVLAGVK